MHVPYTILSCTHTCMNTCMHACTVFDATDARDYQEIPLLTSTNNVPFERNCASSKSWACICPATIPFGPQPGRLFGHTLAQPVLQLSGPQPGPHIWPYPGPARTAIVWPTACTATNNKCGKPAQGPKWSAHHWPIIPTHNVWSLSPVMRLLEHAL